MQITAQALVPALFSHAPPRPEVSVCVVIPVKDEQQHLKSTLAAFAGQVDTAGKPFNLATFEILILANNCTDNSVAYIQTFQQQHPALNVHVEAVELPPQKANIGYVRRLLMNTACNRLPSGGIIMTTDGDTRVAPDWIAQTEAEIKAGADAIGGRILLCPQEIDALDAATQAHHFKDEAYQLLKAELEAKMMQSAHNPAPTHHQHFNGSFAVTKECYALAGGVPKVAYLEDCAFFERLQRVDAKVRHSNKVVVHTSARYLGRTEVGLSSQLNVWKDLAAGGTSLLVEPCASIVERLTLKKSLLDLWNLRKGAAFDLSERVKNIHPKIEIDAIADASFFESPFFGEWYASVIQPQEAKCKAAHPPVVIDVAIAELQEAVGKKEAVLAS